MLKPRDLAPNNDFYTYHCRPKYADDVQNYQTEIIPEVAIVLQGPLKTEDNFTVETVRLYKKYYPGTKIIVSTWDTESDINLAKIKAECEVCVSHFVKDKAQDNYQRTNTLAGIRRANELGVKYVLKTRTDQRIYTPKVLSFFINLLEIYPLRIKCSAKSRIITCGLSTFCNRLYNNSDMLLFGWTSDLLTYFSCPEDKRDISQLVKPKRSDYSSFVQYQADYSRIVRTGEIRFSSYYLESLGFNLKWTYEDSDYYRRELYIIIDDSMLDLYWPKYSNKEYRWRNYRDEAEALHQVTFMEWFNDLQKHGMK